MNRTTRVRPKAPRRSGRTTLFLCLFGLALPANTFAGPANPEISVVGDVRGAWLDDGGDDAELDIDLHEVELALLGPVNPWASAELYLGIHGTEGVEVEEAKLILERYLPAGLGLTIGRKRLDFGQIGPLHPHSYPFLDAPLMHTEFFGEDGAVDTGARLDWIAPLEGPTLRATLGVVRGEALLGGHSHDAHEEAHEEASDEAEPEIGFTGRVDLFVEASESVSFLLGASTLHGEWDPHEKAKATWFDVDGKARIDLGPARSLVFRGEAVFGRIDEIPDEQPAVDPTGWFASADLNLDSRWNVGGFAESTTERLHDDETTSRYGGFVGYGLLEESTLFRLVGRVTDPEDGDRATEVIVQTLFGLGPHRPHRY